MCSSCIVNGRLRQQTKGLTKGFEGVRGHRGGEPGHPSPTSEQAAGELITPPYLQLKMIKIIVAKRCGLWYNGGAV